MTATTYCVRNDVISIIGLPSLIACIDDNSNGVEDGDETVHVTNAIERAAVEMNAAIRVQYKLFQLAGNAWCKWCNAYLTAFYLYSRRGNAPPGSVMESVLTFREQLEQIRWGRLQIPEQSPTFDNSPTVSNMTTRLNSPDGPVVVDLDRSTGPNPVQARRNIARTYGW